MYLLLFINPYTTYYNHQENNSLQQVSKKHAAFEITCSICESSTLHSPYSHRGVTFSDNDKIFHFRFSVLKTTCSHYKIPLPVFTFLKKYTLEQHYLNYIFNFNSTSQGMLSLAAIKYPYIIKAVQCFLRMKAEPYEIREQTPAHLYIGRKKILGFSIKAESV